MLTIPFELGGRRYEAVDVRSEEEKKNRSRITTNEMLSRVPDAVQWKDWEVIKKYRNDLPTTLRTCAGLVTNKRFREAGMRGFVSFFGWNHLKGEWTEGSYKLDLAWFTTADRPYLVVRPVTTCPN